MEEKIKVAFFADILEEDFDGVTRTLYQVIHRIPHREFDFIFITPHLPKDPENFPFPIIQCPSIGVPTYSEYRIALPPAFWVSCWRLKKSSFESRPPATETSWLPAA